MKRFFLKGLIVLLPLVLTTVVLYVVFGFLYNNVGVPIGDALKWSVREWAGEWAFEHKESWFFKQGAPLLGFAVAILLTLVIGFFVATFFGKKIFGWFEVLLKRIPVIGVVYPYARQFTDFFLGDEKQADFKTAVAVPFPTRGVYAIGFVTSDGMKTLNDATHKHLVSVFVPTSPTPFGGFVVYVPREDMIPLPLTVDEAMRIIITAGVIHPPHQMVNGAHFPPASTPHPAIPEELAKGLAPGPEGSKS